MHLQPTRPRSRSATRRGASSGVLALAGYGVRVYVERGRLTYRANWFGDIREGRLSRATAKLRRLVVLGHTGFVTLEALRWLADVGAAFVQVDADGRVVACYAPSKLDNAKLRRAQALAPFNGVGLSVAKGLVRDKLQGQLRVLYRIPDSEDSREVVSQALSHLDDADAIERLRLLEAAGAAACWDAWRSVPVRFARKHAARIPDHWLSFGGRSSPLTGSPRSAANPANALLNYLYSILETEARIAALTLGLDPGMGVMHADQSARDSLALDLMEPVRPDVDAFVLDLLDARTFSAREFFETRTGGCRLVSPLPAILAETAPRWAALVGPVAERVAQTLHRVPMSKGVLSPAASLNASKGASHLATLLTQANRSAGRDGVRRQPKRTRIEPVPTLPPACLSCGSYLSDPERRYCDDCLPERRTENLADLMTAGPQALAQLVAEGRDPTHGGEAAHKRGQSNARRVREAVAWNAANPERPDPEVFRREILPRLEGVPLSAIVRATGLSLRYCSLIRRGLYVPHARHWPKLDHIAAVNVCP